MSNRHLARSVVLQVLFERNSSDKKMSLEDCVQRLTEYSQEFGAREADAPFMKELLKTVLAKQKEIDEVIVRAAPEWPLDRIAPIDRNILRLGLAELLFSDRSHVPAKVAINEAIELAKTFGAASSGRFVNGVLGAVYIELGEPGKNEGEARKKAAVAKMPTEDLAGAVVFAENEGEYYLAFVHDIFGHWTLSKGKIAEEVDVKEGTIIKVKEEMGLNIKIKEDLGKNEYIASDPELGKLRKQVHYYLAESTFENINLAKKPGLDDAKWFRLEDIAELNFYDDILPIVTKAVKLLSKL